jgi:hypothetical protein
MVGLIDDEPSSSSVNSPSAGIASSEVIPLYRRSAVASCRSPLNSNLVPASVGAF